MATVSFANAALAGPDRSLALVVTMSEDSAGAASATPISRGIASSALALGAGTRGSDLAESSSGLILDGRSSATAADGGELVGSRCVRRSVCGAFSFSRSFPSSSSSVSCSVGTDSTSAGWKMEMPRVRNSAACSVTESAVAYAIERFSDPCVDFTGQSASAPEYSAVLRDSDSILLPRLMLRYSNLPRHAFRNRARGNASPA
jgi:hypothetical protein